MTDQPYSNREIQLMFENFKDILLGIKDDIKENNSVSERRFKQVELEIKVIKQELSELKSFKVKALTLWGIGVAGITFVINKYL